MTDRTTLNVRRYKAGYEVREEQVDGMEYGGADFTLKSAYTPSGDYIGDQKTAYRLCKKRGIKPETISAVHNVCSIGYCEKEQKWYGWSHRAIYGFGIGSTVKIGSCGYKPSNKKEFIESLIGWYNDEMYGEVLLTEKEDGVQVVLDPTQRAHGRSFEKYPEQWGRGEWTVETMEDAKQMAIDFAKSVS